MQEQVGQKGCTTSCAPLLPTKYISTYYFSNWCFIANSLGLVLRRRFNIPWPAQPAQPAIECLKSSVAIPTSRLPSPLNRCVLGWGWYLPFNSIQLMMTLLVHHRCCLLHAHNMHNYRLCACYWFQSVQFHPALGSGIAIQREFQYLYANKCTTLLLFSAHLPFTFDAVSTSYLSYSSL